MGLWPGDDYFGHRYEYATEYVRILRDLWETGVSDLKGDFFTMDDCRLSPRPQADMKIICAGQSDAGMDFTAQHADYNFCFGRGLNTPTACSDTVERMQAAAARTGRKVASYCLFMVITGETDAEAEAKYETYKAAPISKRCPGWSSKPRPTRPGHRQRCAPGHRPELMVNLNMGLLVGSHETVAQLLNEVATIPGLAGVLLTFDEFISGTEIRPVHPAADDVPPPCTPLATANEYAPFQPLLRAFA